MIEELKKNMKDIDDYKLNVIDEQFEKSKKGISEMKKYIDNIIFCRIQKKKKKNDELLLKTNLDNSNEMEMMWTLTELNIIPVYYNTKGEEKSMIIEKKYLFFLLSKIKSKNMPRELNPFEFWKTLLKFKGFESK